VAGIEEVVTVKGYHRRQMVPDLETLEIQTYISEPNRGLQSWIEQRAERDAVYANYDGSAATAGIDSPLRL
jgi:hypothetical protein